MVILGASFDAPKANAAFKEKFEFPFDLLCDTERALGLAYGACKDAGARHPDRVSVVIGEDGTVLRVYPDVNAKTHFDDVLRDLGGTPPPPDPSKKKGLLGRLFGR